MTTVEQAQGREYDFVILDLVTPGGKTFPLRVFAEPRRMCVIQSIPECVFTLYRGVGFAETGKEEKSCTVASSTSAGDLDRVFPQRDSDNRT